MRFPSRFLSVAIVLSWSTSVVAQPAQPAPSADQTQAEGADRNDATMMATSTDSQARAHFARGRELYDAGSFDQAAQEFEQAYRLSGRTELLFNMYLSYRDSGELSRAIDALRRYLGEAGVVEDRTHLQARLRSMEEAYARQRTELEEATRAEQEAAARASAQTTTTTETQPAAQPPPRRRSIVPWVVGGVGVAMLAAGTVTGLIAMNKVNDLDDDCPDKMCPAGFDLDGERDSIRPLVTITDVLLIGGAAVVGAAALWFIIDSGKSREERPPSAAPSGSAMCTDDGCSASIQVAF